MALRQQINELDKLMGGQLSAQFQRALNEVLQNIADTTTPAKKPRTLTIKLTFSPDENREVSALKSSVKAGVVEPADFSTVIYLDKDDHGNMVATEKIIEIPGQMNIDGVALNPKVAVFTANRKEG